MDIYIEDCIIHGFRDTFISNTSALNLKDKARVRVDRCILYDNYIAFRLRGPGSNGGCQTKIRNCVVYGNVVAVRLEDDVENVEICNNTFDENDVVFENGNYPNPDLSCYHEDTFRAYNNAFIGQYPAFAVTHSTNILITESDAESYFKDRSARDYHLTPLALPLMDTGITITSSLVGYPFSDDMDQQSRPYGLSWDIGADEYEGTIESITVSNPVAGNYTAGESLTIQWSCIGFTNPVRIEFYNGESWSTIINSTDNDGMYIWIMPLSALSGCRIRLSDAADGYPVSVSSLFDIVMPVDSDGDGLPDIWEIEHFGDLLTSDGSGDYDGDGYTDWDEYIGGSVPTNALSFPVSPKNSTTTGCEISYMSVDNYSRIHYLIVSILLLYSTRRLGYGMTIIKFNSARKRLH